MQEEEEEYAAYCEYPQRCGRQKHLDIEVRFKERRSRGSAFPRGPQHPPTSTSGQELGGQDPVPSYSTYNGSRPEEPSLDSYTSEAPQVFDPTQFPALMK
jgi:hypothetical protein